MDLEEIQYALEPSTCGEGRDMKTRDEEMAGWFTNSWRRVSPRWRWTLLATIPGTAIGGTFLGMGIHTIIAGTCANCTGYGATYAAAGALMLVGAPAYTFLTERKIERKMAKLRTTRL